MNAVPQFVKVMQSPQTLTLIQRDIDRAMLLGINGTPMVLINGVELKGWEAPRAVETAVEAIIAANPPAQTAKADMPVLASEKYVADWRDQPARSLPPEQVVHAVGDVAAPVEVVVYGDFQEPNTARVDAMIREAVEKNPKLVSAWINLGNAYATQDKFTDACDAYAKVHAIDPSDPRLKNALIEVDEVAKKKGLSGAGCKVAPAK